MLCDAGLGHLPHIARAKRSPTNTPTIDQQFIPVNANPDKSVTSFTPQRWEFFARCREGAVGNCQILSPKKNSRQNIPGREYFRIRSHNSLRKD
jgi:hypothetical protein